MDDPQANPTAGQVTMEVAIPATEPVTPAEATAQAKPEAQPSEAVKKFIESLSSLTSDEEKMKTLIAFLKESLSQGGRPRFKDFWDARRLALTTMQKEGQEVAPALVAELTEVSQEARRMKNALDEQSAAAVSAMEQTIQALEVDVHHLPEVIRATAEIEMWPASLKAREAFYREAQREAGVLNQLAQRLTNLRKEVLSTDMRIRTKNQLLARVSGAGDKIYPRRKELIGQLSQAFSEDVAQFVAAHFSGEQILGMLNQHREEIKALQQIAKQLVLNAASFNKTRAQLGEAWDKVKKADQERKRVRQERESAAQAANSAVEEKITALEAKVKEALEGDVAAAAAADALKGEALQVLRSVNMHRDQVKVAKDRIFGAVKPLEQKESDAREEKRRAARGQEEAYRKKVEALEAQVAEFLSKASGLSMDALKAELNTLSSTIAQGAIMLADQERLERQLGAAGDILLRQQASAGAAEELPQLVREIKKRRAELRSSVDQLRKSRGGSALDVSKGLQLEQDLNLEKERLDQINQLLYEVETRLYQLQQG
jgi:hypothetical protein